MLSDSYIQYVESLTLESPEIYGDQGPGESSSRRRSNPSGWGSRPGYNSGHELGKTLFSGTIGDAEEGVVPLVEELARSKGETVAEVAAEAENPYTEDLRRSGRSRGPGMARNPQESSAALYETFHQKAPERIDEYEEHVHYHGWLAELGEMREVKVDLVYLDPPKQATIEFEPGTKLGCSENGRQLYLVGGDQSLDLEALGFSREWIRDFMLIGVLSELTYRTKKGFDQFQTIDYYHEVGEDTGDLPVLAYDNMNQQLMIIGGKYNVEYNGIVN